MIESYGWYLQKTAFPVHLGPFYPLHDKPQNWSFVALSLVAINGSGTWAWLRCRTQPWLAMGVVWFVVSFLPVIGILHVGAQAYADRYTYVPCIGLLVLVVWELEYGLDRLPRGAELKVILTIITLLFHSTLTYLQIGYWHSAPSLWTREIELHPHNWLASFQLGLQALRQNDHATAFALFHRSLELRSDYPDSHLLLASIYQSRQEWDQAEQHNREVLKIRPDHVVAIINLGVIARSRGRYDEARSLLETALKPPGNKCRIHVELGRLAIEQGNLEQGLSEFLAAIRDDPLQAMSHECAAAVYEDMGQRPQAIHQLERALESLPNSVRLRMHLADLLHRDGQTVAAIRHLQAAISLNPDDPLPRRMLDTFPR